MLLSLPVMMKALSLYIKHQASYLLFLIGLFVMPLALYLQFSPYKAPKFPYVILGVLVISQYAFHREKDFRKKHEGKITAILKRELGRVPSRTEVIRRADKVLLFRGVSIGIAAFMIIGLMIFFREL